MVNTRNIIVLLLLLALQGFLSACTESGYLVHSIRGHFDLMSRARPIDAVLRDSNTPVDVRTQLQKALELRHFAVATLHLPDNGSYRDYADLERPYAVWNLVAAPEFSLELQQWCFPVAGCVSYRGYFDESRGTAMASALAGKGYDVDLYGVQAYSTLNWFDDPVLNTFLLDDDIRLASLLFHEMAHQVIYLPGDTAFNEAFAKTVEIEGLRRWFDAAEDWQECQRRERLARQFRHYLDDVRGDLAELYRSELDPEAMRRAKSVLLAEALADYARLKEGWGGYDGFDRWMEKGLNNARLSSVAVYHDLVPAFQQLLSRTGYDLPRFYAEVKDLAALDNTKRLARLQRLLPQQQAALD